MSILTNINNIRNNETSYKFEGCKFGDISLSFFVTDAAPGTGPELHRHPYEEVFVILEGQATFTIGDQTVTAGSGDILHAPANAPHKFINSGQDRLSTINIHPSERVIQEMLE